MWFKFDSYLPDDIIAVICCYLEPSDMFSLCQCNYPDNNKYQIFLALSLSRNICKILMQGSTDFVNNRNPFESFREMAMKLPPKSVCIR